MKTDSLFYRLFLYHPQLAMDLLDLEFSGESYWFGSEEIKQTAFRLDGVFKPLTDNPKQPLIFAEVQYQPDEAFYGRFFSEITLYLYLHQPACSWLAFVIYPTRNIEKAASLAFQPFMNLPQLRRIYLEDYQTMPEFTLHSALMRLIACPESQTAEIVQELVENQAEIIPEILDFIETILVYKLPKLSREEIRKMFNLQNVELKQTRFYQEAWSEGREEGLEEGREEGREEGLEKGFEKGRQGLLQQMLIHRFGKLPKWATTKLNQATAQQLEFWAIQLLNAPNLKAVFKDTLH